MLNGRDITMQLAVAIYYVVSYLCKDISLIRNHSIVMFLFFVKKIYV